MKRKDIKLCGAILAIVMIVACLPGCGGKDTFNENISGYEENLNPVGEYPVSKERIKLTIATTRMMEVIDYKDNAFTKALEEKVNADLEFVLLPQQDAARKIELMVAAGGDDLPDILNAVGLSAKAVATYGKNGMVIPLNQYYEKSSYYIKQAIEKEGEGFVNLFISPDENIYVVPTYGKIIQNEYAKKLWIYQPWLDQLDLKVPTTTEEFKNLLTAFKERDPNNNGRNDEIPFLGSTNGWITSNFVDFFMSAFVYADKSRNYLYADNGVIKAAYIQTEWKDGINYLNDLCKNGLLSPSSFTIDDSQFKQITKNPNDVLVGSFTAATPSWLDVTDSRREEYKVIGPLTGPNGVKNAIHMPTVPGNTFSITKNCKNPEAAFRMADIMWSEEMTIHARFGVKGVDWVEPEPGEKGMFEHLGYPAIIKPILNWGSPQNSHWQNHNPVYRDYNISCGMVAETNVLEAEVARAIPEYMSAVPKDMVVTKFVYTLEEMDEIGDLQTSITAYLDDITTRAILGQIDINNEWDNYLAEMNKLGVKRLLEISQAAYDRMKK